MALSISMMAAGSVPYSSLSRRRRSSSTTVDGAFGTHSVDQKPAIAETRQDTLDLLRLALMPEPLHGSEHGHRVILESLNDHFPFSLALLQSLPEIVEPPANFHGSEPIEKERRAPSGPPLRLGAR
jgi:hypothetical protein